MRHFRNLSCRMGARVPGHRKLIAGRSDHIVSFVKRKPVSLHRVAVEEFKLSYYSKESLITLLLSIYPHYGSPS